MTKEKTDKPEKEEKVEPPKDVQHLLGHIQRHLKAPKAQYNKFGEFYYRDAEDILDAVKPLLPEGASLTCEDEIVTVGDRFYVKSTATLEYKDKLKKSTAFAREPLTKKGMDEMQISGAASSYARKFSLNGLLAIDDSKDSDATNKTKKKDVEDEMMKDSFPGAKSAEEAKALHALCGGVKTKLDDEQIEQMYQQALTSLGGCVDFESLKKVWANYYKTRKAFPPDKFEDIEAKYHECKAGFAKQANGAH